MSQTSGARSRAKKKKKKNCHFYCQELESIVTESGVKSPVTL